MDFKKLGNIFFKYRSYTPLPFVFLMILFINPTIKSLIIGFLIAAIGEGIRLWAVSYAGSETRVTSGVGGTYLVTQGPYAIVRNPLYWGNIIIYFGMGVMSNALFPYLPIAGLVYFFFQYYCIILTEEDFLRSKFKDVLDKYYNSVSRFMPGAGKVPQEIVSKLSLNFNAGWRSEKRTLQSFFITIIIILFFFFTGIRIF